MRVLDPAMGSGHFLVEATEYIAGYLVDLALTPEGEPTGEADLTYWKRRVAQNCIYGVDLKFPRLRPFRPHPRRDRHDRGEHEISLRRTVMQDTGFTGGTGYTIATIGLTNVSCRDPNGYVCWPVYSRV